MTETISQEQLQAICDVLGDTTTGLTKSEIDLVLRQCKITVIDAGGRHNGLTYTFGLSKRKWLHNCLVHEYNQSHNFSKIYAFIENALNPVRYTTENKRVQFEKLREEINKVLLLIGCEVQSDGKLHKVVKATTLDEVDRRVNSLKKQFYHRAIHSEVVKYCKKDYLRKDYYDTVFEAAKGVAQRIKDMTELQTDGSALFQTAFSTKAPYLLMNGLTNQNEISEHNGLRELLEAIFHLVFSKYSGLLLQLYRTKV